jgi:hypothetical protein
MSSYLKDIPPLSLHTLLLFLLLLLLQTSIHDSLPLSPCIFFHYYPSQKLKLCAKCLSFIPLVIPFSSLLYSGLHSPTSLLSSYTFLLLTFSSSPSTPLFFSSSLSFSVGVCIQQSYGSLYQQICKQPSLHRSRRQPRSALRK